MISLIACADALHLPLPDLSVDLVLGSPPYMDARTYGLKNIQRNCPDWISWMLEVTTECLRVCRGPVVWVVAGVTRARTYWPGPEGLAYEWFRRGGSMYRPCYWHRVGIPGSGGDDWFRSDVETILCFKRAGKLPWSDNTAMGHPPKWAPGGEASHRARNGSRVNKPWGCGGGLPETRGGDAVRRLERGNEKGTAAIIPKIANPGNLLQGIKVGGGLMGDRLCHENEAPFPEALAEWFIKSLCPPSGTVMDPFSGSGTTAKVALSLARSAIALDLRSSQCDITRRRVALVDAACASKMAKPCESPPLALSLEEEGKQSKEDSTCSRNVNPKPPARQSPKLPRPSKWPPCPRSASSPSCAPVASKTLKPRLPTWP